MLLFGSRSAPRWRDASVTKFWGVTLPLVNWKAASLNRHSTQMITQGRDEVLGRDAALGEQAVSQPE